MTNNDYDFPTNILTSISNKELLENIIEKIYRELIYTVSFYYEDRSGVSFVTLDFVRDTYKNMYIELCTYLSVLKLLIKEDVVEYFLIEDILILLCGEDSDEVYTYRDYIEKFNNRASWKEEEMWDDFKSHKKMKEICSKYLVVKERD